MHCLSSLLLVVVLDRVAVCHVLYLIQTYQVSRIRRDTHVFEVHIMLSRWWLEISRIREHSCYVCLWPYI